MSKPLRSECSHFSFIIFCLQLVSLLYRDATQDAITEPKQEQEGCGSYETTVFCLWAMRGQLAIMAQDGWYWSLLLLYVYHCTVQWVPIHFEFVLNSFTKGQLISKANSKLFTWTKNQRKYFCISALASKNP